MWAADEIMVSILNVLVFITVIWLCKRLPLFLENSMEVPYFELKGCRYTHTYTYTHIFPTFAESLLHIVNYATYFKFTLKWFRKIIERK